jgi:NADH-quinone oxidoreductase subunit H
MLLMSILMVILFFGGWLSLIPFFFTAGSFWLIFKTILVCIGFILIRGALPRYRYDQLMGIGWKIFLPFTLGFFYFVAALLIWFNAFPYNDNELVLYYLSTFNIFNIE